MSIARRPAAQPEYAPLAPAAPSSRSAHERVPTATRPEARAAGTPAGVQPGPCCATSAHVGTHITAIADALFNAAPMRSGWRITLTVTPLPSHADTQPTPNEADDVPSWRVPEPFAWPARAAEREHPAAVMRRLATTGAPPRTRAAWARAVPGLSARALGRAVAEGVLAATPRGTSRGHNARLIDATDLADFVHICDLIDTGRRSPPEWYDRIVRPR